MDAAGPKLKELKKLEGVKGWLFLLCVSLTVLDPLAVIFSLFMSTSSEGPYLDQHPEFFRLVLVSGICRLGLMVGSLYAGLALWRVVPGAVAVARKYLSALFLYSVFSLFLPALVGVSEARYPGTETLFSLNATFTMVYIAFWYIYLRRSRRVRATYYEDSGRE